MRPRIVTYHRGSTIDQNPRLARAELDAAARARGERRPIRIEEWGSGRRNDRPGLLEVLDLVERGKVAAVLVWKLDRFGRSPMDLLTNIERVRAAGARFVAITQGIDVGPRADATADLILRVLAAVAAFETDLISERTRLAYADAKRRGIKWGRPSSIPADVAEVARQLWYDGRGISLGELRLELGEEFSRAALWRAVCSKSGGRNGHIQPLKNQARGRSSASVR